MPADVVTAGFCPQYFGEFAVPGSKPGTSYTVSLSGASAHCTCPAYRFSSRNPADRECKHVRTVWQHGCLANPQWKDAGPNDLASVGVTVTGCDPTARVIPGSGCPGCGAPQVAIRIAV